ncbi:MAG TPA: hypothetical protein VFV69_13785 [Steroidobacteraceae bacterium]|nr:hypothetical protein [Steroidobacteraceae bacterium]
MTKLELTAEELKLVQLHARLPMGVKARLPVWIIEIGAPLALAVYGTLTHKPVLLGAAAGGLIVMNANRMFRQFRYADHLQSICSKTWG